jgi:hypothetical protein
MSSKNKAALVRYMPVLVEWARRHPDQAIDVPRTAPMYNDFINRVRQLTLHQWQIGVGRVTSSGSGSTITLDKQVVCGSDTADCTGEPASAIIDRAQQPAKVKP